MTLDEAIKSLESILNNHGGLYSRKGENAFQLGIEALKVIKLNRPDGYIYSGHTLPGETEE